MTIAIRIALGSLALGLGACATTSSSLDLQQLRIVDEQGVPRLVLTAKAPGATRKVEAAGILFNDAKGNEIGGVALVEKAHTAAFCFDYGTARGEAMCMTKVGEGMAGTWINDPASVGHDGAGSERLRFSVNRGRSEVLLSDSHERPRIRLSVDSGDVARIEILDAEGKVVYTLPPTS